MEYPNLKLSTQDYSCFLHKPDGLCAANKLKGLKKITDCPITFLIICSYKGLNIMPSNNIVVVSFLDESKAYQYFSEFKQLANVGNINADSVVLVQRSLDGSIQAKDSVDSDYTGLGFLTGTLMGSLVGMLGGPVGMLLGAVYGSAVGGTMGVVDDSDNASLIEQMLTVIPLGATAVIATVNEENEAVIDGLAAKLNGFVLRRPQEAVADEIAANEEAQREAAKQARKVLHEQKKQEFKDKVDGWKADVKQNWSDFKAKL